MLSEEEHCFPFDMKWAGQKMCLMGADGALLQFHTEVALLKVEPATLSPGLYKEGMPFYSISPRGITSNACMLTPFWCYEKS